HANKPANYGNHKEKAKYSPQKTEPKRPDLPAEVRLEPSSLDIFFLYIVHNNCHDPRYAKQESDCLQGIYDRCQVLRGLQSFFGHDICTHDSLLPTPNSYGARSRAKVN